MIRLDFTASTPEEPVCHPCPVSTFDDGCIYAYIRPLLLSGSDMFWQIRANPTTGQTWAFDFRTASWISDRPISGGRNSHRLGLRFQHQEAKAYGLAYSHRVVYALANGLDPIWSHELIANDIHHRNEDARDNRLANLVLLTPYEHRILHRDLRYGFAVNQSPHGPQPRPKAKPSLWEVR